MNPRKRLRNLVKVKFKPNYWRPILKPASKKEIAMIKKRAKEFPENFVPLD